MTELPSRLAGRLSSLNFAFQQRYKRKYPELGCVSLCVAGEDLMFSFCDIRNCKIYSRRVSSFDVLDPMVHQAGSALWIVMDNVDPFVRKIYEDGHPKQSHV